MTLTAFVPNGMRSSFSLLTYFMLSKLFPSYKNYSFTFEGTVKAKPVPLQAWSGPEGSRKLRLPDYMTTAQDGGRLSALRTGRLYPTRNTPGTHFC